MRIFISWSGERSRVVAEALSRFIPIVLQRARVYLADTMLEAGADWRTAITDAIRKSNFGISCLTKDNINSPWLAYEFGVMSLALEPTHLFPLLIDLSYADLVGPMASFQASRLEQSDMRRLLLKINRESEAPLPDEVFNESFDIFWRKFEQDALYKMAAPESAGRGAADSEVAETLRRLEQSLRELNERVEKLERDKD